MKIPWFNRKKSTDGGVDLPFEAVLDDDQAAEINIYSPTWKFIQRWAEEELQAERARNDSVKHICRS